MLPELWTNLLTSNFKCVLDSKSMINMKIMLIYLLYHCIRKETTGIISNGLHRMHGYSYQGIQYIHLAIKTHQIQQFQHTLIDNLSTEVSAFIAW